MIAGFTVFYDYLQGLQRVPLEKANEHTFRTDIENLLRHFEKQVSATLVIHERPSLENTNFRPDFVIEKNNEPVSCVETKKLGENLKPLLQSEQLNLYRKMHDHVLFTNYIDWYWFRKGEETRHFSFCSFQDIQEKTEVLNERSLFAFKTFLKDFFGAEVRFITNLRDFATALGEKAAVIRDYLRSSLNHQNIYEKGTLFKIYEVFKRNVQENIEIETFSNAFAQTIVYGLFIARMNSANQRITLQNAKIFISQSFRVVKELVTFFEVLDNDDLYDMRQIIATVLTVFNNFESDTIFDSLSFEKWHEKLNSPNPQISIAGTEIETEEIELDPYIYFFEDFLAAFDPEMRRARGVYYTPPEVVHFIIKSTDQILRRDFDKPQGFANQGVTALDFAVGTGAFMMEIFRQVYENLDQKVPESLVQNHLLNNIFGFEYLLAPYTIAHLKLSQFLREKGYELLAHERIKVFLTNTLSHINLDNFVPDLFMPEMAQETIDSQKVKNMPVLVIAGNPPYSNYKKDKDTQEKNKDLMHWLEDYKEGLDEKKINIDDDYIKFIRFAHHKIEMAGQGVVAVITNNSYLDGITHRKMREKLYETFDRIYILNLHGNAIKNEGDTNVFDIRVGVAIAIFVKLETPLLEKEFYYFSSKENEILKRKDKIKFLKTNSLASLSWQKLELSAPYFWFVRKDFVNLEYEDFWSVKDIFQVKGGCVKIDRDLLFTDYDPKMLSERIQKLLTETYSEKEAQTFQIKSSSGYDLLKRIKNITFQEKNILPLHYRPFSKRFVYYQQGLTSRPAFELMQHIIAKDNILLLFTRLWDLGAWNGAFVSTEVAEIHCIGGQSYGASLYLYENDQKTPNFTPEFAQFVEKTYTKKPTPEQVLGYIYAVLHNPTYRTKYAEFLKIDFPKIPFVNDFETFEKLANLGWELVEIHLFKKKAESNLGVKHNILQKAKIEQIQYGEEKILIGKGNYISGVPTEVFDFQIGSYKVLDKWLKDRKGLVLDKTDFDYVVELVKILDFTLRQMEKLAKYDS